jgi:hypothetical protein
MKHVSKRHSNYLAKIIVAYEQMRTENETLFEEMLYLIKGIQQRTITWDQVSRPDKTRRRLPKKLEQMTDDGYFKRSIGNHVGMIYITEEGRQRLCDIFDDLYGRFSQLRFRKKNTYGNRPLIAIAKRGEGWGNVRSKRIKVKK